MPWVPQPTANTRAALVRAIAVSKPLDGTVAIVASVAGVAPARTFQPLTPVDLAFVVVPT